MPARNTAQGRLLALLAALCAATTLGIGAASAAAATLGNTGSAPKPSCPRTPCEAVGKVTGIQLAAGGEQAPFKAREQGRLVAWAIDLSRPDTEQRDFFGEFYGSEQLGIAPTARISVLRRGDGRDYKLTGQSPVVDLSRVLGSYQVFTLSTPLRIKKGEFLGLTIPTWAPAFAVDLSGAENLWRASRGDGRCKSEQDIRRGKPQQKVGSQREYGCDYRTARLLYWGFYEKSEGGGGQGGGGGGGGSGGGGTGGDA